MRVFAVALALSLVLSAAPSFAQAPGAAAGSCWRGCPGSRAVYGKPARHPPPRSRRRRRECRSRPG